MFQNGQTSSVASRSASSSVKDFTPSPRRTPASRRERISTTSEKDRTLSHRPATDRSISSVSPMQRTRSDSGPHLSYPSSSFSSNHNDKFFLLSDPTIFNTPIHSEPTYPYSRARQTLFGNLNNWKARSLPLTPTASPAKVPSRERRVYFPETSKSSPYYKERVFSPGKVRYYPGTESTVSSTDSSFLSLKDSNPNEALLKYKMKYESPNTNLGKKIEDEVSVGRIVSTAQLSVRDLETNNLSMDTVEDKDYIPGHSTAEETKDVTLGDIRPWRLPLSTPSDKKHPQRVTWKMQPKISSEPPGNYSKIPRPETLQTNFSNTKTKFSRISTDDVLDPSLKRTVALKSPNRIQPLHLNIEIAPQNISESPSGESVICGIALRMEEAVVRPRKVFTYHTPPIRKSITGLDVKHGMFTPKSVFEPKNYAIRNLFPKSPSETDYLEELEDLDHFLEDQDQSPGLNNTIEWETQSLVNTGLNSTSTVSSSTNRTPPSSLETKPLNRTCDVSSVTPECNAIRTRIKPHSTNSRSKFAMSPKSHASESPSETDYFAELEDLDRFLEDQDRSPRLNNTIELETQSPLNTKVFARHTPPIRKTRFDEKRGMITPKSVFQPKMYAIRNLFPKSPASESPSETYIAELEDLDRFLEDQDRSPRLNNTIEWETQSPINTGLDCTSTVSSSTNRTPSSSLETKALNRTCDVSAVTPEYNAIRTHIKPHSTNSRSKFAMSPKSHASESPSETDYFAEFEDLDRFLEDQDQSPRLNNTIELETQSPLNTKVFARHTPPIRKTRFDEKRGMITPKSVFQPKVYAIRNLFPKSPASESPSETYIAELEDLDRFLEDQDRSPRLNNTIEWETQSAINTGLDGTSTVSSSTNRTPSSSLETKALNRTCDVSAVTPEYNTIRTHIKPHSTNSRSNFATSPKSHASESPSEKDYFAELEDLDRFLEDQDQSPRLNNTIELETQSPLNTKVFARHTPPIRKTRFDEKRGMITPKSVFQPKVYAIRNLFPNSPASESPSETYIAELEDLDRFLEDQDRSPRLNNTIEWETQSPINTGLDSTSTVSSSRNRTPSSSVETKALNRTCDVLAVTPEYNAIRTRIKPHLTNSRSNFSLSPQENILAAQDGLRRNDYASTLRSPRRHYPEKSIQNQT
ncbi:uncharacterized protein TNCT_449331 [Trichonephila clavata]|uniref:Uncharacterized protein n=1 Tax=Trichonephila clavata TaxID=2740835 RepID=A0A8X6KQ99_TRICU|nr:uncharacterized protein TNCT_449331 [Trichonephila clavata]